MALGMQRNEGGRSMKERRNSVNDGDHRSAFFFGDTDQCFSCVLNRIVPMDRIAARDNSCKIFFPVVEVGKPSATGPSSNGSRRACIFRPVLNEHQSAKFPSVTS